MSAARLRFQKLNLIVLAICRFQNLYQPARQANIIVPKAQKMVQRFSAHLKERLSKTYL